MDLADVGRALRRFWLPSAAVFLLTVVAGYLATSNSRSSFESTATVAVTPNSAVAGSADAFVYQIPVIVERVGSRTFFDELAETVPSEVIEQIESLSGQHEIDTGIVRIAAAGGDRDATAEVANAAAELIIADYTPSEFLPQSTATTAVIVEVIEEAYPPDEAGLASLLPVMLASVVLGAILALAVAVIAQRSSRAFDLPARFRNEVGVPVLAVIPPARELHADDIDLSELLATGPAPLVEAFQSLRTRIDVLLPTGDPTLAITSWERGEGRTTVTAGLGLMLSSIGRKVVVIDTNLRNPQLHERLGEPFATGLSEFERLGRANILTKTHHPNLELVSAGAAKSHPAQILAMALPETLEEVKAESNDAVVLLDAPPLGPVRKGGAWVQFAAETSTVLHAAGRVLLVVDASTQLPELAGAVERLQEEGVHVIGAVLNRRRQTISWH